VSSAQRSVSPGPVPFSSASPPASWTSSFGPSSGRGSPASTPAVMVPSGAEPALSPSLATAFETFANTIRVLAHRVESLESFARAGVAPMASPCPPIPAHIIAASAPSTAVRPTCGYPEVLAGEEVCLGLPQELHERVSCIVPSVPHHSERARAQIPADPIPVSRRSVPSCTAVQTEPEITRPSTMVSRSVREQSSSTDREPCVAASYHHSFVSISLVTDLERSERSALEYLADVDLTVVLRSFRDGAISLARDVVPFVPLLFVFATEWERSERQVLEAQADSEITALHREAAAALVSPETFIAPIPPATPTTAVPSRLGSAPHSTAGHLESEIPYNVNIVSRSVCEQSISTDPVTVIAMRGLKPTKANGTQTLRDRTVPITMASTQTPPSLLRANLRPASTQTPKDHHIGPGTFVSAGCQYWEQDWNPKFDDGIHLCYRARPVNCRCGYVTLENERALADRARRQEPEPVPWKVRMEAANAASAERFGFTAPIVAPGTKSMGAQTEEPGTESAIDRAETKKDKREKHTASASHTQ